MADFDPGTRITFKEIDAFFMPKLGPKETALLKAYIDLPSGIRNLLRRQNAGAGMDYIEGKDVLGVQGMKTSKLEEDPFADSVDSDTTEA